jgi:hypothetical protein
MPRLKTYFSATEIAINQISSLLKSKDVPVAYKTVIETVIDLQLANSGKPISRTQLTAHLRNIGTIGMSKSAMAIREKELANLGVIEEREILVDNKRVVLREIQKLSPLISKPSSKKLTEASSPSRVTPSQIQLAFDELNNTIPILGPTGGENSRIDALFTGVLDAAVRLSQKDKRKEILCGYRFGTENVTIKTVTLSSTDAEILILSDYRVIRALNEMYVAWVEKEYGVINRISDDERGQIKGDYVFDVYDLCTELGLARNSEATKSVRKILSRLAQTEFKIDATDAPTFRSKFTLGAHEMDLRYLTEARQYKETELLDAKTGLVDFSTRLYMVRFHSAVLAGLLNDETRHIAHPALIMERSGIAHRFNNWCKIRVGVRPGFNDKKKIFLLDELWEEVMVSSRLDNFCEHFQKLLARECVDGKEYWSPERKCRSLIYGYYIEFEPDQDVIREQMRIKGRRKRPGGKLYPSVSIWRDSLDPYVGDNSQHNLALRRVMKELSQHESA